jgi:hypothetical protein
VFGAVSQVARVRAVYTGVYAGTDTKRVEAARLIRTPPVLSPEPQKDDIDRKFGPY